MTEDTQQLHQQLRDRIAEWAEEQAARIRAEQQTIAAHDLNRHLGEEMKNLASRIDRIPMGQTDRFVVTSVRQVAEHLRVLARFARPAEVEVTITADTSAYERAVGRPVAALARACEPMRPEDVPDELMQVAEDAWRRYAMDALPGTYGHEGIRRAILAAVLPAVRAWIAAEIEAAADKPGCHDTYDGLSEAAQIVRGEPS